MWGSWSRTGTNPETLMLLNGTQRCALANVSKPEDGRRGRRRGIESDCSWSDQRRRRDNSSYSEQPERDGERGSRRGQILSWGNISQELKLCQDSARDQIWLWWPTVTPLLPPHAYSCVSWALYKPSCMNAFLFVLFTASNETQSALLSVKVSCCSM